jgi:HD-GYP domain-containing protein (c-di-GMP phosphodiesterase class II)
VFRFEMPFPVTTAEGEELLPSWTPMGEDVFDDLARRGRRSPSPRVSFLGYGSIREDLGRLLAEGSYRVIFDTADRTSSVLALMEKVSLPVPVLDGIVRFAALDPYTYRHALAVFALSTLLSRELAAEGERIDGAEGGPLHDFGKVAVPLQVLRKKTPLTWTERELLNYHTFAGAALLAYHCGDTGDAVRVALEHHERRDGSGYLRGIPLASSLVEVVAVCDVYDALVAPRPYRPVAFDNRSAIEEITAMAGEGKFGMDAVRALVAVNRRGRTNPGEVTVSLEMRGAPPPGNLYGRVVADREEGKA